MASSPLIHIFWDIENIKSANINESISQLLKVLSQMIPDIEIEISAYGDRKELTEQQKTDFLRNKVDLFDITHQGGKRKNGEKDKNDADRKIMTEMFSFAFKNPPPAYIMLISGDSYFYRPLTSLSTLGYSTVLVYPQGSVSECLEENKQG
ncbi:endonuclease, partial [Tanacetum coccineum]